MPTVEKPILFSAAMVNAILRGEKTQTRRVVTRKINQQLVESIKPCKGVPGVWYADHRLPAECVEITCPFGRPGDRLWVRETWRPVYCQNGTGMYSGTVSKEIEYAASEGVKLELKLVEACDGTPKLPASDYVNARRLFGSVGWFGKSGTNKSRWRPSIHMPRWASRITLEITGVRVERLQEISAKDILAEGAVARAHQDQFGKNPVSSFDGMVYMDLKSLWAAGWDSINGKRGQCKTCRGHGVVASWAGSIQDGTLMRDAEDCPTCKGDANSMDWNANPWVWAISFRRIETTA